MIRDCDNCGKPYKYDAGRNIRNCSAKCRAELSILKIGSVHGRWTVIENRRRNTKNKQLVTVRCTCGTERTIQPSGIKNGTSKSCGCLMRELRSADNNRTTHGRSKTPEWSAFHGAKRRCNNPKDGNYYLYGERGIQFRFDSFEQFFAEVGLKPSPKHSLDRIDNNGHYEPGNVRWATASEQNRNQRKVCVCGQHVCDPKFLKNRR